MSDDIPVIFAQTQLKPRPVVIFLSASHATQMEQYVVAGWQVLLSPSFTGCDVPADLNVDVFDPSALEVSPNLVIGDVVHLTDEWRHTVTLFTPDTVKINAAFTEDPEVVTAAAAFLGQQGYTLSASHWSGENVFGYRCLDRIDALSVFQPTPWTKLNLIAYKDADKAADMVRFGRFYAGQEKRIGELEVSRAVRSDYITQLEDALMAYQKDGAPLKG
ncbi:MAG: hypothetical protein HN793_00450 [Rhodospirillaceae bacterium]|jgi:hypothetical protein|nr:hypothetical protein [Rhodospirillaceae bacterium]MBT5242575.1 hypothetical protein [Rhodospirillaceae bacterium]MBT5565605.1 hypothetical protein [Rhodospirillaceae bacterium]MBT6088374.1 hypothetical protein [Rhodospirillaceae bacterium]MBT7449266.1 hypothetical protein [Rhodospirillaceae bacterium]